MQTQSLLLAIDKAERQLGRPGISVYAADLPTVAELLVRLGPRLPQPQICVTQIEQTGEPPHHTLWLPMDRSRPRRYGSCESRSTPRVTAPSSAQGSPP